MWARGDWGTLHMCDSCWYSKCKGALVHSEQRKPIKAGAGWLPSKGYCVALLHTPGSAGGSARYSWFQVMSVLFGQTDLPTWSQRWGLIWVFLFPVSDFRETFRISLEFQKYFNIFGLNWLKKISWILRMMKCNPGHTDIVQKFWHWLSMEQGFCWQLL